VTAQRWWVRMAARWLARFDGVKGQVQMFSLAVTAFSTFSIMLQGFGLGHVVPYIGVVGLAGGIAYTYLYTEGGVWNQMSRDRQDMSANWAGPNSAIQGEFTGRSAIAAQLGRPLTDEERAAVRKEREAVFDEYREGIELD